MMLTEHRKDPATPIPVLLTVFFLPGSLMESAVKNVEVVRSYGSVKLSPRMNMVVHHVTPTQHRLDVATFVRVGKPKMASTFPVLLTASCQSGRKIVHAVLHAGKDPKPGSVRLSVQMNMAEPSVTPTQPRSGSAARTRVLFPVFGIQGDGVHALFHVATEHSQEK